MKFIQIEKFKILSNAPLIKFTISYYCVHYSLEYGNWTFKWHIIDNNASIFPVVRQGNFRGTDDVFVGMGQLIINYYARKSPLEIMLCCSKTQAIRIFDHKWQIFIKTPNFGHNVKNDTLIHKIRNLYTYSRPFFVGGPTCMLCIHIPNLCVFESSLTKMCLFNCLAFYSLKVKEWISDILM